MDQGDQKQRRRGAVDRINTGIDSIRKAQTAIKIARTAGTAAEAIATSEVWGPVAIIVGVILLIIIFVVIIIVATTGGGTGSAIPVPGGGIPGSGNISSCLFTRAGQEYSINSSVLAGWINDAANRANIPPSVLASVAMHENLSFVANVDDSDNSITTNRFCNEGEVFCERAGQNLHRGSCSNVEVAGGARNARAVGLMQIVDVFHPGEDLCSITESLSIAAQKLKADGITTAQPTQDQINIAIERYYNSCTYDSYSYCNEVWQDYQSCQAPISTQDSCPIPNGVVTCGSERIPIAGCGHCTAQYLRDAPEIARLCNDPNYPELHYAMDIGGGEYESVYLPKINGHVIIWTFANQGASAVYANQATQDYSGVDQQTGDMYYIRFHHTQIDSGITTGTHPSGDVGARICGGGCGMLHVHVELLRVLSTGGRQPVEAPNYFSCVR